MRNEKVVIESGGTKIIVPAKELVLPDVRCLALCLEAPDQEMIIWSFNIAKKTLDRILRRQRSNYVKELFEIDVPDLYNVSLQFPKEEQAAIMDFWVKYHAVVRHFLPKASPQPYHIDVSNMKGGLRYHGKGWLTKANAGPSLFDKEA